MTGMRIRQARLIAGYTQTELAARLSERGFSVTSAAISKYENGKSHPPAKFMLLAANEMNVPSTYFSHKPVNKVVWKSFRRRSRLGKKKRDAVKQFAADRVDLHIELHSLLFPGRSPELPHLRLVRSPAEAEKAALDLRECWDLGNRPLDNLVQTAEDRGVIVISWEDGKGRFDGLSGNCGEYPVTVVNSKRTTDRVRFNLAHEIGHLLMDTSLQDAEDEESLAHRFAAALLVPAEHAYQELGRRREWLEWEELKVLKRKYGMSMAAWIIRARDLQIISNHRYSRMYADFGQRGWKSQEPAEYVGDEEPLQLKQMAYRAVAEGLMSPDRIERAGISIAESSDENMECNHLTVRDLLAMQDDVRQEVMNRAFALAAEEDFEVFEANEIIDDYNEVLNAEANNKAK